MSKKYPLLDDKEWLEGKYLEERLSALKIAKIIGCSHPPVLVALKHFSIQIRSHSEAQEGKHLSEETRSKMSEARKGENNPNWKGGKVKCICEVCGKTFERGANEIKKGGGKFCTNKCRRRNQTIPNHHTKPERIFEEICKKNNLPFKYTGDGAFWIGGKPTINPDFIHLTKKIVVEIFSYWHDPLKRHCKVPYSQTYEGRKKILKKRGWKMIVFWQDDLEREDAEARVLNILKEEKVI